MNSSGFCSEHWVRQIEAIPIFYKIIKHSETIFFVLIWTSSADDSRIYSWDCGDTLDLGALHTRRRCRWVWSVTVGWSGIILERLSPLRFRMTLVLLFILLLFLFWLVRNSSGLNVSGWIHVRLASNQGISSKRQNRARMFLNILPSVFTIIITWFAIPFSRLSSSLLLLIFLWPCLQSGQASDLSCHATATLSLNYGGWHVLKYSKDNKRKRKEKVKIWVKKRMTLNVQGGQKSLIPFGRTVASGPDTDHKQSGVNSLQVEAGYPIQSSFWACVVTLDWYKWWGTASACV